jgi:hypothetical protein
VAQNACVIVAGEGFVDSLVVALLLGFVGWLLYHRRRQAMLLRRLARHGIEIRATVVRRRRRRPPKGARPSIVEYEFTTAGGEIVAGRASLSAGEYAQAVPGSPIPVVYDGQTPTLNRPRSWLVRKGYIRP